MTFSSIKYKKKIIYFGQYAKKYGKSTNKNFCILIFLYFIIEYT